MASAVSPSDDKDRQRRTALGRQSRARWTIAVPGLAGVAAMGLSIAMRKNHLPGLRVWRRWTTTAFVAAGFAEMGLVANSSFRDWVDFERRQAEHTTIQVKAMTLFREVCNLGRDAISGQALQKAALGSMEHEGASQTKLRADPNNLALTPAESDQEFPLELQSKPVIKLNMKDGPHTVVTEPGTSELKPGPETNYEWSPRKGTEISELENHISQLQTYRAKLAKEAQVLWQWLAEKEGQYYRLRDSDAAVGYDVEQAKQRLLAYIRILSSEHVMVWIALSKIDWVIADSRKRITQYQQLLGARPEHASHVDSVTSSLDFVHSRVRTRIELAAGEIEEHERTISQLERARKDPALRCLPEEIRVKLKDLPNRDKVLQKLIAEGQRYTKEVMLHKAAVEDILRDAENRAVKESIGS